MPAYTIPFDSHDQDIEIKVARDPRGGYRVWVHLAGELVVRSYASTLHLDGLRLVDDDPPAVNRASHYS